MTGWLCVFDQFCVTWSVALSSCSFSLFPLLLFCAIRHRGSSVRRPVCILRKGLTVIPRMSQEPLGLMKWTGVLLLAFRLPSCSSAFAAWPLCLSLRIVMSALYEHCHWNTHWNDISHKAKPMLIARWKGPPLTLSQCVNVPRYLPIVICSQWRQEPVCCCTFECTVTEKTNLTSPPRRLIAQPRL